MPMSDVEILRAACCIAGLDEDICEKERPLLNKLAARAGVGRASLEAMIERAATDQNFYQEQFRIATCDPDLALKTLFTLAIADHALSMEERVILQHFAEKLGVSEDRFNQLLAAAQRRVEEASATSHPRRPRSGDAAR